VNVRTLILTENSTRAGEGSTAAEAAASQTCVKYHEQSIAVVCHSPSNQIWVSHSRNRQDERACDLQFSNDGEWVLHERGPVTPEAARRIVLENIDVVSGTETVPPHAAVGRIAAEELLRCRGRP
jgi:hypothetical protein